MSVISRLSSLVVRSKIPSKAIKMFKTEIRNWCPCRTVLGPTLFATTFYNLHEDKLDTNSFLKSSREVEEEVINKAFISPEPELLELMEVLEKCIIESCAQYRICIRKQIEIIEKSSRSGIYSDYLDELPEYRTLAFDLSHELNNYIVLLKTVGEMTYQHLMSSAKGESIKDINLISEKYKNLEILLQKQLDENRKFEMELNTANRIQT
ncbi:uncharacterized protein LOC123311575 isoform X1 [Coccinella septempunctata]|uniref:uncharacterized protein LOC123311575 isoform X1 n=1 Tax=Coccinella septempunctata TaxID=41139 RepID=UPI001D062E2B|nr:uncharacterized protein LOC123311575 isoform X1 [Coccinella septempunctata]